MTQQAHTFIAEDSARLDYWLHLPAAYTADAGTRWPLILFLHGRGERGADLDLVKIHGIAKVVETQPDFPFITVAPQCPITSVWMTDELDHLNALLDSVIAQYAVDTERVYLTGLSMGGFGTWHLAARSPERFAAIAPVCGGGPLDAACQLKTMPIWAFHGDADEVVPVSMSETIVAAVQACGGTPRLTVYPGVNHDSWTQTYANPELYTWFRQHRLSER